MSTDLRRRLRRVVRRRVLRHRHRRRRDPAELVRSAAHRRPRQRAGRGHARAPGPHAPRWPSSPSPPSSPAAPGSSSAGCRAPSTRPSSSRSTASSSSCSPSSAASPRSPARWWPAALFALLSYAQTDLPRPGRRRVHRHRRRGHRPGPPAQRPGRPGPVRPAADRPPASAADAPCRSTPGLADGGAQPVGYDDRRGEPSMTSVASPPWRPPRGARRSASSSASSSPATLVGPATVGRAQEAPGGARRHPGHAARRPGSTSRTTPTALLPLPPLVDIGAPDALATIASGPATFARASVLDPGDILANPGAVLRRAEPGRPRHPAYPFRITANSGTAPSAESNPGPGLSARVTATDEGSTAEATASAFDAPAVATVGSLTAKATTATDGVDRDGHLAHPAGRPRHRSGSSRSTRSSPISSPRRTARRRPSPAAPRSPAPRFLGHAGHDRRRRRPPRARAPRPSSPA